jgi:hypothetical protein
MDFLPWQIFDEGAETVMSASTPDKVVVYLDTDRGGLIFKHKPAGVESLRASGVLIDNNVQHRKSGLKLDGTPDTANPGRVWFEVYPSSALSDTKGTTPLPQYFVCDELDLRLKVIVPDTGGDARGFTQVA